MQPAFVESARSVPFLNIVRLIKEVPYDLYIEPLFFSDQDSLWAKQTDSEVLPRDERFHTFPQIQELLKGKPSIHLEKTSKSAFKGNVDLGASLREKGIEELHVVGYDTDDCVFATANESFDLGFFTYVIEECTGSSSGNDMHDHAIAILRNACLTNNSCVEKITMKEI